MFDFGIKLINLLAIRYEESTKTGHNREDVRGLLLKLCVSCVKGQGCISGKTSCCF